MATSSMSGQKHGREESNEIMSIRSSRRSSSRPSHGNLGVLEFCSALNSNDDDPLTVTKYLQRFVEITRRQRREALLGSAAALDRYVLHRAVRSAASDTSSSSGTANDNDNEESCSSSSDDSSIDSTSPSSDGNSIQQHEQHLKANWMKDIKSYSVPFIGTSINKSDLGNIVIPNQWPTGFLLAYLNSSPLAIEIIPAGTTTTTPHFGIFLNNNNIKKIKKQKQNAKYYQKVSNKLVIAHMNAIAEILTIFIPRHELLSLQQQQQQDVQYVSSTTPPGGAASAGATSIADNDEIENHSNKSMTSSSNIPTNVMRNVIPIIIQRLHTSVTSAIKDYKKNRKSKNTTASSTSTTTNTTNFVLVNDPTLASSILVLRNIVASASASASSNVNHVKLARQVIQSLSALPNLVLFYAIQQRYTKSSNNMARTKENNSREKDGVATRKKKKTKKKRDKLYQDEQLKMESNKTCCDLSTSFIYLTLAFLNTNDPFVISQLVSSSSSSTSMLAGEEDKKNMERRNDKTRNGGLLNLVLRVGLKDVITTFPNKNASNSSHYYDAYNANYYSAVTRLIQSLLDLCSNQALYWKQEQSSSNIYYFHKSVISCRTMVDLLSGTTVDGVSCLASMTSRFNQTMSQHDILYGKGFIYGSDPVTPYKSAVFEARRFVCTLLCNHDRSPMLLQLSSQHQDERSRYHDGDSTCKRNILLTLSKLLSTITKDKFDSASRNFVLHCLRVTPSILPHYFMTFSTTITTPDSIKGLFMYMSFISYIVRNSPDFNTCLLHNNNNDEQQWMSMSDNSKRDLLLSCVVPLAFNKAFWTRILLQSSSLIQSEALKLLTAILDRANYSLTTLITMKSIQDSKSLMNDAFVKFLPDIHLILNLRSKLNPYQSALANHSSSRRQKTSASCCDDITFMYLLGVIGRYLDVLPKVVLESKFDWCKLLPESVEDFETTSPLLQYRVLALLADTLVAPRDSLVIFPSRTFRLLMILYCRSSLPQIRATTRRLMIMAILSLVNKSVMNKNFFVKSCIEHEANAWIDNLSIDIIDEVQASFEECKGTFLDFVIPIRMAWNEKIGTDRRMPDLQFTPLLMKSIESLEKKTGNVCDRFSLLVATVAEQCLLSQTEPLPLAVIVVRLAGRGPMEHLANYATQLIERLPREQAKPPEDDLSYGEQNCLRAMHLLIFPLEYDDKTISDNIISAETRKKAHLSTIQRIAAKTACYDMVSSPFCLQMISRTLHLLSQSDHADGASAEMAPGLYFVLRICMVAAFQNDDVRKAALLSICKLIRCKVADVEETLLISSLLWSLSNQKSNVAAELLISSRVLSTYTANLGKALFVNAVDKTKNSIVAMRRAETALKISFGSLPLQCRRLIVETLVNRCETLAFTALFCPTKSKRDLKVIDGILKSALGDNRCQTRKDRRRISSSHVLSSTGIQTSFALWAKLIDIAVGVRTPGKDTKLLVSIIISLEESIVDALDQCGVPSLASSALVTIASRYSAKRVIELCVHSVKLLTEATKTSREKAKDGTTTRQVPNHGIVGNRGHPLILCHILRCDLPLFFEPFVGWLEETNLRCENPYRDMLLRDIVLEIFTTCKYSQYIVIALKDNSTAASHIVRQVICMIKEASSRQVYRCESLISHPNLGGLGCFLQELRAIGKMAPILSEFLEVLRGLVAAAAAKKSELLTPVVLKIAVSISLWKPLPSSVRDFSTCSTCLPSLRSHLLVYSCLHLPKALGRKGDSVGHGEADKYMDFLLAVLKSSEFQFSENVIRDISTCLRRTVLSCLKSGMGQECGETQTHCLCVIRSLLSATARNESPLAVLRRMSIMTAEHVHALIVSHSNFAMLLKPGLENETCDLKKNVNWSKRKIRCTSQPLGRQRELLRLLLCCVALGGGTIKCDEDTRTRLLMCYSAGVGYEDCCVRRILHLYDQTDDGQSMNMRFLVSNASKWLALTYDELQGTTIRSSASSITERNTKLCAASPPEQMLPHLINLRRVRATLSQIPIWDTLYPPSEVDVERRFLVDIDSHVDHKSDDAQGDPKSETDSDSSVSSDRGVGAETAKSKSGFNKTRVKSFRGGKTEKKYKEEWKNGGCDIRYSLSFLMPLVLAVLDTCNLSNGNVSNDGLVAFNCDREESLARLCQCLCEKGGLALSLASLSSQCPLVRQAAIGILGLVLRSLETAQSSNNPLTKWSATPQLRMLLHSVQLGVSLRRISQLERRKIGGEKGSHAVCLPMLPAVSALFLARSSLVLMHPDDIMYSSINAYFLRLSSKGAFRDTSRVPGFISLFCPTDDKEGNAKSARLWALQLLKDGMIDKFCFKAATRCHAPSLLLSSFDTFAATCSSTKEVEQDLMEKILLLRTLTKMLESGGPRAVNHFIRNLGLLSWIKVILLSQKKWPAAGSSVNAIQLRIEVVSLVCTAVVQAETDDGDEKEESRSHHRQWLYTELSSLPGAIIDFFMETTTVSKNDATNTKTLTMKMAIDVFCRLVGDCIWIVKEAIDNVVDSGEPLRLWASTWGVISLDGACALLKHKALDKKMKMKIAWALCVFPYRHYGRYHENVGTGGTSALLHDFGAAVTTTILNLGNDCGDDSKDDGVEEMIRLATPVILERIRNLWRTSYNVCAIGQCDDVRLLYNMLLLRSNAVLLEGGTRLWNAAIVELMSIKEVVPEVGSEIEATRLAFDACLHNQEKIASFSAAALDQQQG